MPTYIVNTYDIIDFDMYQNYLQKVNPLLKKFGAKVLAMKSNPKVLEGKAKMMNIILEFESETSINNFYNDSEYKDIIELRLKSTTNCSIIILNKFEPN
ncbi:MAG: DUF1330 domain-containing protein [Limnohabitans sp.]|nr:DUF1330 domain-containing protein [Limnohabitans sp.]